MQAVTPTIREALLYYPVESFALLDSCTSQSTPSDCLRRYACPARDVAVLAPCFRTVCVKRLLRTFRYCEWFSRPVGSSIRVGIGMPT